MVLKYATPGLVDKAIAARGLRMAKKTITLCASVVFYEHVNEIADALEEKGFDAVVPKTAEKMRESGNYEVSSVKTWYDNPDHFTIKRALMDAHFAAVEQADAILVVNDKKHGVEGYIGPNVLMEMAVAYHLKKPIYILNDINKDLNVYEEVYGMNCQILNGKLEKIIL